MAAIPPSLNFNSCRASLLILRQLILINKEVNPQVGWCQTLVWIYSMQSQQPQTAVWMCISSMLKSESLEPDFVFSLASLKCNTRPKVAESRTHLTETVFCHFTLITCTVHREGFFHQTAEVNEEPHANFLQHVTIFLSYTHKYTYPYIFVAGFY